MKIHNRREFLKTSAIGALMLLAGGSLKSAQRGPENKNEAAHQGREHPCAAGPCAQFLTQG